MLEPTIARNQHKPGKVTCANVRVAIEDRSGATFRLTIKQLNVAMAMRVGGRPATKVPIK